MTFSPSVWGAAIGRQRHQVIRRDAVEALIRWAGRRNVLRLDDALDPPSRVRGAFFEEPS